MKFLALIGAFGLALALAACGGSDSADTTSSAESILEQELPRIEAPKGPPPKNLVIKDLETGTGRPIKATDDVAVRYVGVGYRTGKRIAYRTSPLYFQVGVGRVMPGFDKMLVGMKLGGRREAIIPPRLTYEEGGPNEPLIYVVDLLGFESGAEYAKRLKTGEHAPFP